MIKHNEFLPYGELFNNNDPYLTNNDYLYGGKELQKKFGINLYDSQALVNTIPFIDFDLFDFSNEAKYKQHLSNITNEKTADYIRSLNSFIRAIPE